MYDTLIAFKPGKTSLTEGLATNWNVDGKTVTLDLRKNVKFHNGEDFTADDFVATYRRFVDESYEYYPGKKYASSYGPYTLGVVKNVEAASDHKLKINLEKKYAPFLPNLAMFVSAVHSKKAIEEKGKKLKSDPVGTGPFKLKNWDTSNNRVRLEKNADYWGDGPKVDEVVFTVVGSNTSRAQTLDSGDAHIIDGLGAQSSQQVEKSEQRETRLRRGYQHRLHGVQHGEGRGLPQEEGPSGHQPRHRHEGHRRHHLQGHREAGEPADPERA